MTEVQLREKDKEQRKYACSFSWHFSNDGTKGLVRQSFFSSHIIYSREVESRPPPPVIGDCVKRRDVQLSVDGL